jgi:hypothetical protein
VSLTQEMVNWLNKAFKYLDISLVYLIFAGNSYQWDGWAKI